MLQSGSMARTSLSLRFFRSQPRTGSRDCALGAGLPFMALPLQNAGGSVAAFPPAIFQRSPSDGAFCVFGPADPARPAVWSLWISAFWVRREALNISPLAQNPTPKRTQPGLWITLSRHRASIGQQQESCPPPPLQPNGLGKAPHHTAIGQQSHSEARYGVFRPQLIHTHCPSTKKACSAF